MASISLKNVYKAYSDGIALSDVNLDIIDKELIVLVGPSGSGKSSILRMIAGLEDITSGELYIDGQLVNDVEPKNRDVAMIFRHYALYPHLTVYDNMAFALRLRKVPKDEIDMLIKEVSNILAIDSILTSKPRSLTSAQHLSVALGRAIVRSPKVLLLDEPLSSLEPNLRVQMRAEMLRLHNQLDTTFVYATYDQVEAMAIGTRIAVVRGGSIQQVDTPKQLYNNPANLFVATFIGTPQMNVLQAELCENDGQLCCVIGRNKLIIPDSIARRMVSRSYVGKQVLLGVRPEDIRYSAERIDLHGISATVDMIEALGSELMLYLKIEDSDDYVIARLNSKETTESGSKANSTVADGEQVQRVLQARQRENIDFDIDTRHIYMFDVDTEISIMGVPHINIVDSATLQEGQSSLQVVFGDSVFELDKAIEDRLIDRKVIGEQVGFGIAPKYLVTDPPEDTQAYSSISSVIELIERYSYYVALYCRIAGKDGYFVAHAPLNNLYDCGHTVTLYCKTEHIMLYNKESGDKLLASRPLPSNTISGILLQKDSKTVAVGTKKQLIHLPSAVSQDTVELVLDPRGWVYGRDIGGVSWLHCIILDIDMLGSQSMIFFAIDGVRGEFYALLDGIVPFGIGQGVMLGLKLDSRI